MIINKVQPDKIVFVHTTCANREEARSIGLACINEHLAACADFWAIESVYPWQGVMEDVDQYMLVLITEETLSMKLIEFIAGLHSYSVPMIVASDTSLMSSPYRFWVKKTIEEKGSYPDSTRSEIVSDYEPGRLK